MRPYPYLTSYRDRHGKLRHYYRRHGRCAPITHEPGTLEFEAAYDALHKSEGRTTPNAVADVLSETASSPTRSGTWRWLCESYFRSTEFQQLHPTTRHVRELILASTFREPWTAGSTKVFGDAPIALITPQAVAVLRDRKKGLPAAANGRLKIISRVFAWALASENGIQGIATNPVKSVRPHASHSEGHHSWTIDEVSRFEKRHPIGTMARLALGLFLFTGQRRSDVVLFGPRHIKEGILTFTQQKNKDRHPIRLRLPVLPVLRSLIEASPCGEETFLVTSLGKPFSSNSFGNKMRVWCDQAELPHCTAHGLRKAGAVIAAHNGATPHQLMAVFGWRTLKEAERYTRAVEQKRVAAQAMALLIPSCID